MKIATINFTTRARAEEALPHLAALAEHGKDDDAEYVINSYVKQAETINGWNVVVEEIDLASVYGCFEDAVEEARDWLVAMRSTRLRCNLPQYDDVVVHITEAFHAFYTLKITANGQEWNINQGERYEIL
jgi:hypothetical protein